MERLQQARGVARGSARDRLYRKFVEAVREEEGLSGRHVGIEEPFVDIVEQGKLPQMRPAKGHDRVASPSSANLQFRESSTEHTWGCREQPEQRSPKVGYVVVMKGDDEAAVDNGEGAEWNYRVEAEAEGSRGATRVVGEERAANNLSDQWQDTSQAHPSPAQPSLLVVNHNQEPQHTIQILQIPLGDTAPTVGHGTVSPLPSSLKLGSEPTSITLAASLSTANQPGIGLSIDSLKLGPFDTWEPQGQMIGASAISFPMITTETALPIQTDLTLSTQHLAQQPDSGSLDRVIITGMGEEPGMTILSTEVVSPTGISIPRSRSASLQEPRRRASLINAATPQMFLPQHGVTRLPVDTKCHSIIESPLSIAPGLQQNWALRRSTRSQTKIMALKNVVTPAASPALTRTQLIPRQARQVQFATPVRGASATSANRKTAETLKKTQTEPHLPGHSYTIQGRHHAYCKACAAERKSAPQTSEQSKRRAAPVRRRGSAVTGVSIANPGYHQFPYIDDVDWQSESMAFRCLQTRNPLLGSSSANMTREMAGHMKSCGNGIRSRSDGGAWEVTSMYVANIGELAPAELVRGRRGQVVSAYFEDWQSHQDERIGSVLGMEKSWMMNSLDVLADAAVREGGRVRERTNLVHRKACILQGQFCPIQNWNGRVDFPESAVRGGYRQKEGADHTEETVVEGGWWVGNENESRVSDDTLVADDSDTIIDPDLSLSTETNDDTIDASDISFSTDSSGDTIDMNDSSASATGCECVTRDSITPPLPYAIPREAFQSPVNPGSIMQRNSGQIVQVRDSNDLFASEYETSSTVGCLGNGNPVGNGKELMSCSSQSTIEAGVQSTLVKRKRSPKLAATDEDEAPKKAKIEATEEHWGIRRGSNELDGHDTDDGNMEVYTNKLVNPNPLFTDELLAKLLWIPRQGL